MEPDGTLENSLEPCPKGGARKEVAARCCELFLVRDWIRKPGQASKHKEKRLDKRMAIINAVISAEHGFVKQRDGLR
jgi:hypothetical protein